MKQLSGIAIFLLISITSVCGNKHFKRDASSNICDTFNNHNKIQCYCTVDHRNSSEEVKSADCFLNSDIGEYDPEWDAFDKLKHAHKVKLTNIKNITIKYIPTKAIKHLKSAKQLIFQYGKIKEIKSYAFANLNQIEELSLKDNEIQTLHRNSFSQHSHLKVITLDTNQIEEINRDVFETLPVLEQLYLTTNKITTLHDRAFQHLKKLKELELNKNKILSLNNETFAGLGKLERLELSYNGIEVVGDYTFAALRSLRYLHLDHNMIQMIDENAFSGLVHLQHLSLANNKLTYIENNNIFEGLISLSNLNIRGNKMKELKFDIMIPIIKNFYRSSSILDFEDNDFPCDCQLDWILPLRNKTTNPNTKLAIENMKCTPDDALTEEWKKSEESYKMNGSLFEEEVSQSSNNEYEYYDESQLNGKLFYIDVRNLLKCSSDSTTAEISTVSTENISEQVSSIIPSVAPSSIEASTSDEGISISYKPTKETFVSSTQKIERATKQKVENHGVLDLAEEESTDEASTEISESTPVSINVNTVKVNKKKSTPFTTTRLATVSAKPAEKMKMYEHKEMAADEAFSGHLESHRDEQVDTVTKKMSNIQHNTANKISSSLCLLLLIVTVMYKFRRN